MGSTQTIMLAGASALAIVAAVVLVGPQLTGTDRSEPVPAAASPSPVAASAVTGNAAAPADVEEPLEEDAAAADTPPEPEPTPEPPAPEFDVLRITPDGAAVIAGRAAPGMTVALMLGAEEITRVTTEANGEFVALFDLAPSGSPRAIRLVADPGGLSLASLETRYVAPFGMAEAPFAQPEIEELGAVGDRTPNTPDAPVPEPEPETNDVTAALPSQPVPEDADNVPIQNDPAPEPETVELTAVLPTQTAPEEDNNVPVPPDPILGPPTTETAAAQPAPPVIEETPDVSSLPPEIETTGPVGAQSPTQTGAFTGSLPTFSAAVTGAEPPAPPAVLSIDDNGVSVLPGRATDPEVMAAVSLDTITYEPSGEVSLSGRSAGAAFVRVYLDNRPITSARIPQDGVWRTGLPNVDTGVYTLRIDEVNTEGEVVSRIETPFKREEPEVVASVLAEETASPDFDVAVRTVQPGNTLWAISREQYGKGVLYVEVFEANRDLIRDPDMIFPGQVFRLPELEDR